MTGDKGWIFQDLRRRHPTAKLQERKAEEIMIGAKDFRCHTSERRQGLHLHAHGAQKTMIRGSEFGIWPSRPANHALFCVL